MIKKILASFLAFFMLFSSMGFTMATHFCAGRAVDTQLLIVDGDIGCGMEVLAGCDVDQQLLASGCCDNEYQKIQLEDDYSFKIDQQQHQDAVLYAVLTTLLFVPSDEEAEFPYQAHAPPLLEQDVYLLNQSFLL